MKNKHRPAKSEVRKQAKAAKRFAVLNGGHINPELWRLVCPKVKR